MIPAAELEQIRTDAETLLLSTCDIERATLVDDGGGSLVETWATVASDVPCRLSSATGAAPEQIGDRVNEDAVHTFTMPADTEVRPTDQVTHESRTWEVTQVPHRTTFDQFVQRVEAKEVDRNA